MAFPPRLFLIGAQKSGTTTLSHVLDHHPEICLSVDKETGFFAQNWDKGLAWYESRFENPECRYLMDASVTYTQADLDGSEDAELIPRRIHSVVPDARFLYLLRHPVERLYSAYLHFKRTGRENRSFDEVVADPGNYFFTGDYAGQTRCYLSFFPRESFLFVTLEQLSADPQAVVDRVFEFLELAPLRLPEDLLEARKNKGFELTAAGQVLWNAINSRESFNGFVDTVKRMTPQFARPWLARVIARPPHEMTAAQRQRLLEMFSAPVDDIEAMTGLDLSAWRR